ncbi:MAG: hypothetical protein KKB50_01625 [Planctomycetes bacterium]|nr:hypothetical protein [Planctomycetota bacterium]
MCAFVFGSVRPGPVWQKLLPGLAVLVLLVGAAHAEDHFWSALYGGSFNYWENWVPQWVPQEDDRAIFELGMEPAYEVTFYESVTNDECLFRTDKVILDLGGFTYTLDHPGFALIVGEDAGHVAEVLFKHGTIDTTVTHVGLWDDSVGTLNLESGLTLNVSDHVTVGNDGDGVMNILNGASVITEYAYMGGHDFGNTGVLNVDGSNAEITVNEIIRVGDGGHGFLNLLNGARVSSQGCYIADASTAYGEVSLTGASEFDGGNWVALGCSGTGLLTITETSQFGTESLYVGTTPGGSATIDVSGAGSRVDASDYLIVGDWGYATMNVSQQAAVTADTLVVGACNTADGELNIFDSGTTVTALRSIQCGSDGVGTINITGGADVRSTEPDGPIYVGLGAGGDGYLLVDGESTLAAEYSALVIADHGHGVVDILGGSVVHTGSELFMGWWEGASGQLTISGAGSTYTADTGYPAQVGVGGEGKLIVSDGGRFEKPGGFHLGHQSNGVGTVTLSGSTTTFWCGEHVNVGEYGVGTFTVNDGRVAVGNVDTADVPSGEVHVGDWGKLTGTGTLIGEVFSFNGGSVRPGGEPSGTQTGVLTIDGNYTQQDADLTIRTKGTLVGDEYSVLNVTGTAHLDGELRFALLDGFEPQPGDTFTIVTAGAIDGIFSTVTGLEQYIITRNHNPESVTVSIPNLGDLDCDGLINGFDIDPFVLALLGPDYYDPVYPDCYYMLADINGDGDVNGFDIDPFVDLLIGS